MANTLDTDSSVRCTIRIGCTGTTTTRSSEAIASKVIDTIAVVLTRFWSAFTSGSVARVTRSTIRICQAGRVTHFRSRIISANLSAIIADLSVNTVVKIDAQVVWYDAADQGAQNSTILRVF